LLQPEPPAMAEMEKLLTGSTEATDPVCELKEPPAEPVVRTSRTTASLDLGKSPGIYESVLVATFGGVSVSLSQGGAMIHPVFMLLLCLPVFVVQVSTIFILRSGLDTDRDVYEVGSSHSEALLKLKLALVIIVYLTNFKALVHGVERLVFVSNPITWAEVKHFSFRDAALLHKLPSCLVLPSIMLCPFCSIIMKFGVAYLVCVDSVSIILSAQTAQDAIFNSLAIGFVVDLGDSWWEFVQHNFALSGINQFKFVLREQKETWTDRGELHKHRLDDTLFPTAYKLLVWATTWKCVGMRTSFLRTGFGAVRVETVLALLLLCAIYTRQLFVVLHAVETNTLPAARDLCEEFKLMEGNSLMWDFFQRHMLVSMDAELMYAAENTNLEERCLAGELHRMQIPQIKELWHTHWATILFCLVLMFCVIVMPSVAIALHGLIQQDALDKVDTEQNSDIHELHKQMRQVKAYIAKLEKERGEAGSPPADEA